MLRYARCASYATLFADTLPAAIIMLRRLRYRLPLRCHIIADFRATEVRYATAAQLPAAADYAR